MAVNQPSLVHETEVQRRHARVKIPATIALDNGAKLLKLDNISASGFGIDNTDNIIQPNTLYSGQLRFEFLDFGFSVPVRFTQINSPVEGKIGCEFQELSKQEISTIRLIITKYLSGEVIQAGDVLSTINRDNYAKPRKKDVQAPLTGFAKFKGIVGTSLFFVLGLCAFAYLLTNIYNVYWVESSLSAKVTLPHNKLYVPREGRIFSHVEPGDTVKTGDVLATIESPLYELMEPTLLNKDFNIESLQAILDQNLKLVVKSPCDCRVFERNFTEGQFVTKSSAIFSLASLTSKPLISASFPYSSLSSVDLGNTLDFSLAGSDKVEQGTVSNITMFTNENGSGYVQVDVTPNSPIDDLRLNQPVKVSTSQLSVSALFSSTTPNTGE
ncbi:HlyD family efflux transporter periplasmic adaptor subunit [Vibrio ponticus]|uniref:HlyD family efflux transporter periplasmic adaptor subunit n=1 Tax=Vibrio ponticus TaxID=265668 RepID=A0A3N3E1P5_9VIBR|nr:HlyD family efflux transporter periplasmic adaptor subunit [Vibrio ponticus]ROV60657.1 HlyD family efflux transporter periplasmic adaptor subunit [Vibrio ponticus]